MPLPSSLSADARTTAPVEVPPAALDFLQARLDELTICGGRPQAGLDMFRDAIGDLHAGAAPQPLTVRLLLYAYTRHEDFDPAWTAALDAAVR